VYFLVKVCVVFTSRDVIAPQARDFVSFQMMFIFCDFFLYILMYKGGHAFFCLELEMIIIDIKCTY
jgi:hypothetical protein